MKNTVQRQIIFGIVKKMQTHPSVEDIYSEIQKKYPTMSKSTVYRNLHQLAKAGEVNPVYTPTLPERFDGDVSPHYHFICKKCGCIADIAIEYLSSMNEMVQSTYGFQVDGHDVVFRGICATCKSKEVADKT